MPLIRSFNESKFFSAKSKRPEDKLLTKVFNVLLPILDNSLSKFSAPVDKSLKDFFKSVKLLPIFDVIFDFKLFYNSSIFYFKFSTSFAPKSSKAFFN